AEISKGTAENLRKLVQENFDRPYLNTDAIAMLSDSASALKHLPDSAEILTGAAGKLQNLTDSAEVLSVAAPKLGAAADNAEMVQSAASDLSSAFTAAMDNS